MKKRQIFTIILSVVVVALAYGLYAGIKSNIDTAEMIKREEARVVEKLKVIREVQKAFLKVHGRYTISWDSLITFAKEGKIPNVQKRETIMKRPPQFSHLGDSVRVTYDTLGLEDAKTKFAAQFPGFNPDELPYLPSVEEGQTVNREKKFMLLAGKLKLEKVVVPVDVIEVWDPFPVDKTRKDDSKNRKRRLLRFGSMEEVTLSGNWED